MKLKTGDIILEKGNDLIDKGISLFTDSEYTHTAIVVHGKSELLVESHLWSGVHLIDIDDIPDEYDVVRLKDGLTQKQENKISDKVLDLLGTKYDLFQIFGYLFSGLFKGKNMLNNPNYIICSELIDIAYHSIGVDLIPDMYLGDIKPSDIARCEKLKYVNK